MVMDVDQIFECSKQFANVQTFAQMFDLLEKIGFKIYRKFAYVDKEPKTVEGFYWRLAIFNNRNIFQTGFDLIDGGFVQMYGKRYRINSPNLLVCIARLCDVGSLDFDPSNYYIASDEPDAYPWVWSVDDDEPGGYQGTCEEYYGTGDEYDDEELIRLSESDLRNLVKECIKRMGTIYMLAK